MKKSELEYKRETGLNSKLEIESRLIIDDIDGRDFEGMTRREIISFLEFGHKKNVKWGISTDELPSAYNDNLDVNIYTPEYVEWLESENERLSKTI